MIEVFWQWPFACARPSNQPPRAQFVWTLASGFVLPNMEIRTMFGAKIGLIIFRSLVSSVPSCDVMMRLCPPGNEWRPAQTGVKRAIELFALARFLVFLA